MALDLVNYEQKTRKALQVFWSNRDAAKKTQAEHGKTDQGERASVTSGKNMDGFAILIQDIVRANGLDNAEIYKERSLLTLPGFFRPTKKWDILVMYKGELIAALELKSQIGPSFGNNINNRTEEAIGTALDFWTAYRDEAFGKQPRPLVGWLMLVEDAPKSRSPIRHLSPHFPIFGEFKDTSYLQRYDLLCKKLMQEQLYSLASIIASPREKSVNGIYNYSELSPMTGMKTFVASLAGHCATVAARLD